MSAWLTSDVHRSALVQEAIVRNIITPSYADELWQRMTFDNHYALYCRYMDPLPCDDWQDVELKRTTVEAPLNPWAILKGISCWGYQCAEFEGWDQTTAHIIMDGLADLIRADLGLDDEEQFFRPEYDRAPWGIDSWDDVIAQPVP